jgi:hypothetical protein
VLLAQNEFAEFLTVGEDDRALLLERLTETGGRASVRRPSGSRTSCEIRTNHARSVSGPKAARAWPTRRAWSVVVRTGLEIPARGSWTRVSEWPALVAERAECSVTTQALIERTFVGSLACSPASVRVGPRPARHNADQGRAKPLPGTRRHRCLLPWAADQPGGSRANRIPSPRPAQSSASHANLLPGLGPPLAHPERSRSRPRREARCRHARLARGSSLCRTAHAAAGRWVALRAPGQSWSPAATTRTCSVQLGSTRRTPARPRRSSRSPGSRPSRCPRMTERREHLRSLRLPAPRAALQLEPLNTRTASTACPWLGRRPSGTPLHRKRIRGKPVGVR